MKKTLASLLASIVLMGTAVAADLPSKTAPVAPNPFAPTLNNWYIGGNVGGAVNTDSVWDGSKPSLGVVGGYQVNRYFGAEVAYDYFFKRNSQDSGQIASVNGVVSYPTGTVITPYALGGVGYGWDYFGNKGIYNVGAGFRTQITSKMDFDVRYRYINNWDNNQNSNVVTGGINYKF